MKAIILAAGAAAREAGEQPILLESLGDQWVVDWVVEGAARSVAPKDTWVVVAPHTDALRAHLGDVYHFVEQSEQLGTGHAVQQVQAELAGYDGELLILYGDTPLFRPDSITGLLKRHRLKGADLTLLTAVVDTPLPYGRVVRGPAGRIVDIIEETDASAQQKEIQELNVGAYVVRAPALFAALDELRPSPVDGEYRLTDCVGHLIWSGLKVDGYAIYDPDEVLGINTATDFAQAEFILRKRLFAPQRVEDEGVIRFGTGGWRAVIGEGFTLHNVRRLSQALAHEILRRNEEDRGVLIGFDRRFLADRAAEVAAEVFAGNNVPVIILPEPAPTPLVTYATAATASGYGLAFTASHNPPVWNGLKVFRGDGALLQTDETNRLEEEANGLTGANVVRVDREVGRAAGIVQQRDFTNAYVDAVEGQVDMQAIREAGLRVVVDPMYGVGKATLEIVLTEARCRVTTIHGRHDPLFGGRSPAPDLSALGLLINTVREGQFDFGLATDGDADRIAIVDEHGQYLHINDLLLVLYYHLHETRQQRGPVVRNLATSHLLDRLAAHFGESCIETPVGFKHIVAAMQAHGAVLGGESSGGLTVRGHILGKDGILAALLVAELLARSGRRLSELLDRVYAITGRLYAEEATFPATPAMRVAIPKQLDGQEPRALGPLSVQSIHRIDGTKLLLEQDSWVLLRFSGTEPVLRIFAEAPSRELARELVGAAAERVGVTGFGGRDPF